MVSLKKYLSDWKVPKNRKTMLEKRSREMCDEIKYITKAFQPCLDVIKDESGKTLLASENITSIIIFE